MNADARILEKPFDLVAVSLFTRDDREYLDCLPSDGRANRLMHEDDQPGGLCSFVGQGARNVAPQAKLALCSTVGEADQGAVHDALDALRFQRIELFAVANKRTNHSRVSMTPSGERQIVRLERERAVNFDEDLNANAYRRLRAVISQSKTVVLGHLPSDLTAGLIDWARHIGTLAVLCPGKSQFDTLGDLRTHALILNTDEARTVTGSTSDSTKTVFSELNRHVQAEQAVIMTTGGGPVFVADRKGGNDWIVPPRPAPVMAKGQFVLPVGCGDVLAGVVGLALGQPRRLVQNELLYDAIVLGQAAATAHYYRDSASRETLQAEYQRLLARMTRDQNAAQKQAA